MVRLTRYVRVPYRPHSGLSRRGVFARDGGRCAYCHGPAETIDHVMPRSRGGPHAWDNVVAACARCNHTKGDRTPAEMGWPLLTVPAPPKGGAWRVLGHRTADPRWTYWLGLTEPRAVEPRLAEPRAVEPRLTEPYPDGGKPVGGKPVGAEPDFRRGLRLDAA